jgi:hypothetical protein
MVAAAWPIRHPEGMAITPADEIADKDRKLRLAESAAASALLHGATPDEVRARVEAGLAEMLASPAYKAQQERLAAAGLL